MYTKVCCISHGCCFRVMSGHSLQNKRVYAPRPQTAPPGCKDKTGVVPLPPSQGSPLLLPKGNSNPGEETKKKQKALVPFPKKSLAEPEEEDLNLDPDMAVWELNRNSPREAIIHVEQETRRPTTPTPPPRKIAAV
jgi:hypothetical protein